MATHAATIPRMTKHELAAVVGKRATQLAHNAPTLVDTEGMTDPILIAWKELEEGKSPLCVRRKVPRHGIEEYTANELYARTRAMNKTLYGHHKN